MSLKNIVAVSFVFLILLSCKEEKKVFTIGFLDLLEDQTLSQAKDGFLKALSDSGYSEEKKNISIIYRNAQGDQPTLLQACDYLISKKPDALVTCPTLSMITAIQKTKTIPVFAMVAPRSDIANVNDANGNPPKNLLGIYETQDYLDTSIMLIKELMPDAKKVATLYNQAEPQSVSALTKIQKQCDLLHLELIKLPVTSSAETQLVTAALLNKKPDAFFALPDNIVFASMETIVKNCDAAGVPVFTSEEGLVKRGAVAAFGADMYQWGYQCGQQLLIMIRNKNMDGLKAEPVLERKKVFNSKKVEQFNLHPDHTFTLTK